MGIMKVAVIAMVTILVVGIILSAGWILVEAGKYVFNQNFNVGTAFAWAWDDYKDMINIWDGYYREDKVAEYPFTNQHVDVVACIDL